jgi:hypothetical protein
MALRMAEYCLQVYRLYGRFPRQVVLYVGNAPLRMGTEPTGEDFSFRYRLVDNVIAILGRLGDQAGAVREIGGKLSGVESGRESYLQILMILAGLRELEQVVESEARKVPILYDILDHKVLGREYKKGREEGPRVAEWNTLRRLIVKRFGPMSERMEERLANRSAEELQDLCLRVYDVQSVEELLQ